MSGRRAGVAAELRLIETSDGQVETVRLIEQLLDRAKAGQIQCFGFAAIGDRTVISGWAKPAQGQHVRLVGALSYLEFRMNRLMDEEDTVA